MKTTIVKKKTTKEDIGKHVYIPVHDSDIKFCIKQGEGVVFISDIKRDRRYPLLQKYWATCNLVAQNKKAFDELEFFDTKEKISEFIKLKLGLIECMITIKDVDGNEHTNRRTKSISNAKMDQTEFQDFFDKAIEILSWMSGISVQDLTLNWVDYENGIGD